MQKQRSITGLTNKKTSASADKLSATASTGSIKKAECVCKICSCGRHRCTGSNHSNVVSVGGGPHAHMNSETENRAQYKQHALPEHKLVWLLW